MNLFNYAGHNKTKNYFEGWYLKVVNDNHVLACIFGISLYESDPHSFIQIMDSDDSKSRYFRFNVEDFYYNKDVVRIKDNILSVHKLKLSIDDFEIDLKITPTTNLNEIFCMKSVMGPFKYLPLPAYHEVIFMNSKIEGSIKTSNIDTTINGSGYMEKNYGICFPKKWLWFETNTFKNYNASLVFAKANVMCFEPFFCILNIGGEEFRFASYNGFNAKYLNNNNTVDVVIKKNDISLKITIDHTPGQLIVAPTKGGNMRREIEESLTSTLTIALYKNRELIFQDEATNVSCENLYDDTKLTE
ncbi:MAG: tocopherol cyclase family protein [Ignavibacteriales bacterium]